MNKEEIREKIESNISKLENGDYTFYFLTPDSKGNPSAAVANIYEHVKILNELGKKAVILHQETNYKLKGDAEGGGLTDWLGEEYGELPHECIQNQTLKVSPCDFIVVPELMGSVFKEIRQVPSKKILFMQAYNYLLEPYNAQEGFNFLSHGINSAITTTEKNKNYLESLTNGATKAKVVPVGIPEYFKPSEKPRKPIVGIFTRDQRETLRFVKSFYTKYPQFKFISFRDLRGLSRRQFAKELSEMACLVWMDDVSGFGTMPVESMKCGVPVIGKVPEMVPEWMTDDNGFWTQNSNILIDVAYQFVQAWLEDSEPKDRYEKMKEIESKYTMEEMKTSIEGVYNSFIEERIEEFRATIPQDEEVDKEEEKVQE
jgi:glycosyltransferase involved in cell wall biosynthesis